MDTQALINDTIEKVRLAYGSALLSLMNNGVSPTSQQGIDFNKLGAVYIEDWANRRAQWALNGQRDDGSSYTLERWVTEGQGYAQDASYRAGLAFDSSTFGLALATAKAIPGNIPGDLSNAYNAVTSPSQWPWYVTVGLGGVALFYASRIYKNFRGK